MNDGEGGKTVDCGASALPSASSSASVNDVNVKLERVREETDEEDDAGKSVQHDGYQSTSKTASRHRRKRMAHQVYKEGGLQQETFVTPSQKRRRRYEAATQRGIEESEKHSAIVEFHDPEI